MSFLVEFSISSSFTLSEVIFNYLTQVVKYYLLWVNKFCYSMKFHAISGYLYKYRLTYSSNLNMVFIRYAKIYNILLLILPENCQNKINFNMAQRYIDQTWACHCQYRWLRSRCRLRSRPRCTYSIILSRKKLMSKQKHYCLTM